MANEDASLLFTVRSTTSLKRRSLFFTSSRIPGSLACEVVSLRCRFIALVKPLISFACEVAAFRRVDVFLFTALRLHGGKPPLIF